MHVIELENVSYAYNDVPILKNISLKVRKRENLVILGASGAGKSTILKIILGLLKPDSGSVRIFRQDITPLKEKEIHPIRHRMGMVFQGGALFDSLPVWGNVGYCMSENHEVPLEMIHTRVRQQLEFVELQHTFGYMPSELSGGMRKRVAIARAIVCDPEIVLFDEPTAGLDPIASKNINRLIVKLRDEKWVSSVVVTHILNDVYAVADRIAMLKSGEIIFEGDREHLLRCKDPYVQEFVQ
ncbi:MAG: ABC transporter ATP-binding protein [bacterium]